MWILKKLYELKTGKKAPYYYDYSLATIFTKPLRKFVAQVIAPNCPFSNLRVSLYRLCGFKIGKNVFIGMKCYLDDMCFDLLTIGDNVIISYGVYFACHGKKQKHLPITVDDGAYIGMRSIIIAKNKEKNDNGVYIGKNSVVGAGTLVNMDIPSGKTAIGIPCKILKESCTV